MNSPTLHREQYQAVRPAYLDVASALFSLSQTQRRLAHIARREALAHEAADDYRRYAVAAMEARRLWREAKWHLRQSRHNYERAFR
jgi:hypothetical protein